MGMIKDAMGFIKMIAKIILAIIFTYCVYLHDAPKEIGFEDIFWLTSLFSVTLVFIQLITLKPHR